MRVLYVNTYYQGGGAEKVMRQLYEGMGSEEIETYCVAGRIQDNLPPQVQVIYEDFLGRAITTAVGSTLKNTLLSTKRAKKKILEIVQKEKIDLIHFHNLHSNYIGIRDIMEIKKYCKNIVITLHDMWIFTGGCAYACECEKWYQSECHGCQGNYSMKAFLGAAKLQKYKKEAFQGKGLVFVTPAGWLAGLCRKSYLQKEEIRIIHNGINLENFRAHPKKSMREKYGLPKEKKILLFAANGVRNIYKGFSYLKEAIESIEKKEEYALLVVGNKEKEPLELPFEMYAMGYVSSEKDMSELYAAADLYILPSMADVYPYTPMEAIASGTPVLAFCTGGIPEIVTKETGWLVEPGNSLALRDKIEEIFSPQKEEEYKEKQSRCESFSREHFDIKDMMEDYRRLYEQMVNEGDKA